MSKKLLVANWKANPKSLTEAVRLARQTDAPNVVVAPPFPFLHSVGGVLRRSALGAQDVFWSDGPYTGEVSTNQLKRLGVRYVIIGHSERRRYLAESDKVINKKVVAALKAGLKVILCVGEGRHENIRRAEDFVKTQIRSDLAGIRGRMSSKLAIAYEPIWAIGTGRADSPQQAGSMAKFIKKTCKNYIHIKNIPVLYGGSINSNNASSFLSSTYLDGGLVGGVSLKPVEFRKLIELSS